MRRWIQLANWIALELRLQPFLPLRSDASRSSKALPTCNLVAGPAKAPKQDTKPGVVQGLSTRAAHRFVPRNTEARSLLGRAPRRRFHRSFAAETANLPDATSEARYADNKARDSFRARKNQVCTVKKSRDHLVHVSLSTFLFRSASRMAPTTQRDLCESHCGRPRRQRRQKIEKDWTRRILVPETAMVSTVRAEEER